MNTAIVIGLGLCLVVAAWAFLKYVVFGGGSEILSDDDDFNPVVGMGMMGGVAVGMAAAAAAAAVIAVAEEETPVEEDDDDLPIIGSPILPPTGEDVSAEGLVAEEPEVMNPGIPSFLLPLVPLTVPDDEPLSPDQIDPPYPTGTQTVPPDDPQPFPAEGQMLPGSNPDDDRPQPGMGANDPDELPPEPEPAPAPITAFPLRMPPSPPAPPPAPDPEPDNASNQGDTSDGGSNDDE